MVQHVLEKRRVGERKRQVDEVRSRGGSQTRRRAEKLPPQREVFGERQRQDIVNLYTTNNREVVGDRERQDVVKVNNNLGRAELRKNKKA